MSGSCSLSPISSPGPGPAALTWVMGWGAAGEHHSPAFCNLHGVSLFGREFLQN